MYPDGLAKDDIINILLATCERLRLFGRGSQQAPAQSRWWSMQNAMCRHVLSVSTNNALCQVFAMAFPTWDAAMPEESADADEDYRRYVRSKAVILLGSFGPRSP
eukprot:7909782-Karenia_brevis.AAC.1